MADLIGCDLEYAVLSKTGYIPAGFLPITGTKGHPEFLPTGGVEIDCCAVELTFAPSASKDQFVNTIMMHLEAVREKYKEYGHLVTTPSTTFSKVALAKAPFANQMGCSPDWNVWTERQNPPPVSLNGFRTFGGHVHISKGTTETIKACDLTLGMWSVIKDFDNSRRKLYGKAGSFRPKDYGVEYRVLSNFWCDDRDHISMVWDLTEYAREITPKVESLVQICGGPDNIQDVINSSRAGDARAILRTIGVDL